jgi:hypothetical protein
MRIGAGELIVLLSPVIIGLPIWGIIDAALRPQIEWNQAAQNKVFWILLQVFLGIFAAIAYFAAIRPKLKMARRTTLKEI